MNGPQHCPGFEAHKQLSAYLCSCPSCGAEQELFSDEFDRPRECTSCHTPLDFNRCEFAAGTEKRPVK